MPAALQLRGGAVHSKLSFAGAPPFVVACAIFAAMDSLLLGYDIGCVSGILLFVQEEFGLSSAQAETFAAAMNSAAIIGALVSGWVADKFGRKPALFMSSASFAVGSTLMSLAGSYDHLVKSRWIQGFGVGSGLLISPMFIAEVAPAKYRGALVTLGEVSLSFGVLLAFMLNWLLSGIPNQWRWMIFLGAVPDILLALRMLFLPESPRFLIGKGKVEQARKVQRRILRPAPEAEADAELAEIIRLADEEEEGSWLELLRPATFTALCVGTILAVLQHAVGIESIIYYSTKIFQQAGITSKSSAILGTVAMGLIKLIFETNSLLNLDEVGRRPLLLLGSFGLTASLLGLGVSMQAKLAGGIAGPSTATYGIFGCLGAYMAFHALSYGPITWLVLAEILPNNIRGKAMGIATMANRLTSYLVASTFLTMSERLQWSGSFYIYASIAALSFFFYAFVVPETNGLRLEEISPLFGKPLALVRRNAQDLKQSLHKNVLTREVVVGAVTVLVLSAGTHVALQ
uniref:Major facilitator superfamily (MFS) profile domain-containing protein n=1 Tax=Coccolithus braarudii TaxID=221442 RepID=A0A7S0LIW5_9EUKA